MFPLMNYTVNLLSTLPLLMHWGQITRYVFFVSCFLIILKNVSFFFSPAIYVLITAWYEYNLRFYDYRFTPVPWSLCDPWWVCNLYHMHAWLSISSVILLQRFIIIVIAKLNYLLKSVSLNTNVITSNSLECFY